MTIPYAGLHSVRPIQVGLLALSMICGCVTGVCISGYLVPQRVLFTCCIELPSLKRPHAQYQSATSRRHDSAKWRTCKGSKQENRFASLNFRAGACEGAISQSRLHVLEVGSNLRVVRRVKQLHCTSVVVTRATEVALPFSHPAQVVDDACRSVMWAGVCDACQS